MNTPAKTGTSPATDAVSKPLKPHRAFCHCAYSRQCLCPLWALLLFLLVLPTMVSAQFFYRVKNDGTASIFIYTGPGGWVTIPSMLDGLPVTSIDNSTFSGNNDLIAITLPDSITSIGDFAFCSATNLTDVKLSANLTNIGQLAFYGCTSLTNITIPNSVSSIGLYGFANCSNLTTVAIGNSVASIEEAAFGWTSLTNVTLPASVTNIGPTIFRECANLTAINVDATNPFYSSTNGVLFNKGQSLLIEYPAGRTAASYVIPDSVTSIAEAAFYCCGSLASITIPNSVTNTGWWMCSLCTNLTSVTMGRGLTSLGTASFSYCISLTSITIPGSVTNLGDSAFYYCTNLAGIYFQGDVPSLGSYVFYSASPTVYYLPGTLGWGTTFGDRPTALWNPRVQTSDGSFGVQGNQFGFNITGTTNIPVVVEACTDLANPIWSPVSTNTLTDGSFYFSDPQWTNSPTRLYRLRWP